MNTSHPEFSKIIQPVRPVMDAFHQAFKREFQSIGGEHRPNYHAAGFLKGKRLRPMMFFLCQGLVDTPKENAIPDAVMIELVHTASLLHDDVIDESQKRRGQKTLNAILGNHFSVLAGDFLIARMMTLGHETNNQGMPFISKAIMLMTQAEIRQAICEKQGCMDVVSYFEIVQGKTSALFEATCAMAGLSVSASDSQIEWLMQFGQQFGIAFQIQDDILDYTGSPDHLGKPLYQDVLGGRWTLPLIMILGKLSEKEKTRLRQQILDGDIDPKNLLELIEKNGGIIKARSFLNRHSQNAFSALEKFSESPCREALRRLVKFNMDRNS